MNRLPDKYCTQAIGIDIGGTFTKAGLVDLETGSVIKSHRVPTEKQDPSIFISSLTNLIQMLRCEQTGSEMSLKGVGVGVSSFVSSEGVVDSTYGFQEFMEDYPLVSLIEEQTHLPCRADNDARIVALGEALFGAGKGYERVLVLTLGTGLGVGFVSEGKFESPLAFGHMAGHMHVGLPEVTCYCGKKGCLEALVSATGIKNAALKHKWPELRPDIPVEVPAIFQAEENGDPLAIIIVNQFIEYLRMGISNYINLFAPDVIVIGGGVAKGLGPYLDRLTEISTLKPYKKYKVQLHLSSLGDQAGILGSAALFND